MSKVRDKRGRYVQGDGAYPGIVQWNRYAVRVAGYGLRELNVSLRTCDLIGCPDAGERVVCVEINSGFANGVSLCLACLRKLAGFVEGAEEEALAQSERYDVENPPVATKGTRYGGGLTEPSHKGMRL